MSRIAREGQATPREIRYISLKILSSVEDDTMQYGALDRLTRKINVKLRFVSSPVSRWRSCAGFSRALLRLVSIIPSHLTLWISDMGKEGETERKEQGRARWNLVRHECSRNQIWLYPTRTGVSAHVFSGLRNSWFRMCQTHLGWNGDQTDLHHRSHCNP